MHAERRRWKIDTVYTLVSYVMYVLVMYEVQSIIQVPGTSTSTRYRQAVWHMATWRMFRNSKWNIYTLANILYMSVLIFYMGYMRE